MPIAFNCSCGERLEVDDGLAGKQARCPYCEAVVRVPTAAPPPAAKRAKLADRNESDDDRGGFAGSLNPLERGHRPSSRRRRDDEEDEDDRPSRRRRSEDEEEGDRPSRRRAYAEDDDEDEDDQPRRRRFEPPPYNLFNNQTIAGSVSIVVSVAVMAIALYFGFCWYGLLFFTVAGFIALIRGLISGRNG